MKRKELLKHLIENGCIFVRHGGSHDAWMNPTTGQQTTIPRHTEIDDKFAKTICKQLSINPPKK